MQESKEKHRFKIVSIGNRGVGKLSLLNRYCLGRLERPLLGSLGVDFYTKTITKKDHKIELRVWDSFNHYE